MEPEPLFKIVALGVQPLHDPSTVRAHLRRILSGDPASVEAAIQHILVQETTLLATELTAAQVAEYQQYCDAIGLLYTVSPMVLHLEDQDEEAEKKYCPACNHLQPHTSQHLNCLRCGYPLAEKALPKWQNWTAAQPAPPQSQPTRPVPAAEPEPLGPTLSERLHSLREDIRDQSPQQRLTLTLIPVGLAAILAGLAGLLFWKQPDISISPPLTPRTETSAPNAATAPATSPQQTLSPQLTAALALYHLAAGDKAATERDLKLLDSLISGTATHTLSNETFDTLNRQRAQALAGLAQSSEPAQAAANRERWSRALTLSSLISAPSPRAQALAILAHSLYGQDARAASAYFNQAITIANTITDSAARAEAFSAIARELADTGQLRLADELFAQASDTARSIEPPRQSIVFAVIAKHRAEAGDSAIAQALLDQIAQQWPASPPWSNLAALPAELIRYRLETLGAMARNRAAGGNYELARSEFNQAVRQTAALADPEQRALVQLYLARNMVLAGDDISAAQLLATVLSEWQQHLSR